MKQGSNRTALLVLLHGVGMEDGWSAQAALILLPTQFFGDQKSPEKSKEIKRGLQK